MENKNNLVNKLLIEIEELRHNMLKHDISGVNKQF